MNTNKTFNIVMAFVFAFSFLGMPAPVSAQEPNPTFAAHLPGNQVHAYNWIAGTTLTLAIDDPEIEGSPDFLRTEIVPDNDLYGNTWTVFELPSFELKPGQAMTITDNITTKIHVVKTVAVASVNPDTDIITGTAEPNTEVGINAHYNPGGDYVHRNIVADANGNWTVNLSTPSANPGEERTYDILNGSWGTAFQWDDDNDSTFYGWQTSNPTISARLPDNAVRGGEWPLWSSVTLTIEDPTTSQQIDFTDTRPVGIWEWDPTQTEVWFNLNNFLLKPGQVLTMTDGEVTKIHTLIDLNITDVNIDTDTVSGTTNVLNGEIEIYSFGNPATNRIINVNPDGTWFADFAVPHSSQNKTSDIRPGDVTEALHYDEDGDYTLVRWSVPDPKIIAYPDEDVVAATDFWPGASVTITIDDPENGVGIDLTRSGEVSTETGGWNCQTWWGYCFVLDLRGEYDVQAGQLITISDGTHTISYIVTTLLLTNVDLANSTVSGTAEPLSEINLDLWPSCGQRHIFTDVNGNWLEDFSVPGNEPSEQETCDFSSDPLRDVVAYQGSGEGETWVGWYMPNPRIGTWPNDDRIEGWEWPLGATITVEVDDPATLLTNPDHTGIGVVGTAPWDSNQTWFEITLNEYDLKQGNIVTVTDGTNSRTTTIAELAITALDPATDRISGIAAPDTEVHVWSDDGSERIAAADSLGDWLVDFSVEQNDQPVIDLIFGSTGNVWVGDEDGDQTSVWWKIQPPQCQPGDTVTGTVFEHDGLTPVPFANIQIEEYSTGEIRFTSTTNQNGQFGCTLPEGNYRILALTENSTHTQEYYNEASDVNATQLHIETNTQLTNINFTISPAPAIELFTFNLQNLLLQDLDIRQAIAFGTDRQRILNEAFLPNGIYGMVSNSIVVPEHWASAPASELEIYPFDPARARAILEAAGWIDRDSDGYRENAGNVELEFVFKTPLTRGRRASGAIFQENMTAIGIRINIVHQTLHGPDGFLESRDFDIAEFAWSGCTDNEPCVSEYVTGSQYNYAGYGNPTYDTAIANARTAVGDAKLPYLIEAQQILMHDLPILPLFTRYEVMPVTTPAGNNVTVSPESYLNIHFDEISQEGVTTILPTSIVPVYLPPNFQLLGQVYDIGTSALFTNAQVCFTYDAVGLSLAQESAIRLFHLENNIWADVTDTGYPDTTNHIVCGTVSSFSPFAVMYPSDTTPPTITWIGDIVNGDSFYFNFVPSEPICAASDDLSGVDGACSITGFATTTGGHTLLATARDKAGNQAIEVRTYTVLPWTLKGFYQPVDMYGIYNLVKGGSTVPLKFEIFAGPTELTDISYVRSLTYAQTSCDANATTDEIETTATGDTNLRYDMTAGQFIYNWKTPKTTGKCYRVTLTTIDNSTLVAYFKLK